MIPKQSHLEAEMHLHLRALKLDAGMEREYRFHPTRQFRFDFAWAESKVALEVEGGIWTGGRHTTGAGFLKDMTKYNEAALLGWKVLRVSGIHIKSGEAAHWVAKALREAA